MYGVWVNLLTVDETAGLLRMKPQWVYKMVRSGVLPSIRLGRQVRIDEAALTKWLFERRSAGTQSQEPEEE